jgi:hypothetical protein
VLTEAHVRSHARRAPRAPASRARLAAPLLAFALLGLSGPAFAQKDTDRAAARVLAVQAIDALNSGKYAEALDLVSRAEQLLHAPTHVLMIGRAQIGLGQLVAAKETLLKLTREELDPKAPAAFKRAQAEGKDELAAIEPKIASLRIDVEGSVPTTFMLEMDGQPVAAALIGVHRPVDPGKHELAVFPQGKSPVKASIELKDGEKREIKLVIPQGPGASAGASGAASPGPSPGDKADAAPGFFTPLRGIGLGAGVLGLGGVAVGAVFLAKGSSQQTKADDLANLCGKGCTPQQRATIINQDSDAAGSKTIGVIGLVGGGVALAAGVTLIVLGKPKPKPPQAFIAPWFSGDAAGLHGAF